LILTYELFIEHLYLKIKKISLQFCDMRFQIQPLVALCDKKINISISELQPFSKVMISASMSLPWASKVHFESVAWFTADANGILDLSKRKPDKGNYDFVDSMGLIASMKSRRLKLLPDLYFPWVVRQRETLMLRLIHGRKLLNFSVDSFCKI